MTEFKVMETVDMKHYMIGLVHTDWNIKTYGSYEVFAARVVGLSFAQYLQYMRDNYDGFIKGRKGYSYICFKNQEDCERAVYFLNQRLEEIMFCNN